MSYTIFSEGLNVEIWQTWAYTDFMLRLPPLGTGLTPLLQWLLLEIAPDCPVRASHLDRCAYAHHDGN